MSRASVIVMGASWGGLAAVGELLSGLPEDFPVPVILVQHRSKQAENLLASLLQDSTSLRVVDIEDKEPLESQSVYVAPPNYHVLVENGFLSLTTDPLVRHSRPSIDVMFMSAADAYREGTIGVVLTGANDDGASGLRYIVDRGGRAIVQDPSSAEIRTMPAAALKACPEAECVPLRDIAKRLMAMVDPSRQRAGLNT